MPRASSGLAFGLVGASFLWERVGSLAAVPGSGGIGLSPFHHVALVPAEPFAAGASAGDGSRCAALATPWLAVVLFERRDLGVGSLKRASGLRSAGGRA